MVQGLGFRVGLVDIQHLEGMDLKPWEPVSLTKGRSFWELGDPDPSKLEFRAWGWRPAERPPPKKSDPSGAVANEESSSSPRNFRVMMCRNLGTTGRRKPPFTCPTRPLDLNKGSGLGFRGNRPPLSPFFPNPTSTEGKSQAGRLILVDLTVAVLVDAILQAP